MIAKRAVVENSLGVLTRRRRDEDGVVQRSGLVDVQLHTGRKRDDKMHQSRDEEENKSTQSVDGNKEAPKGDVEDQQPKQRELRLGNKSDTQDCDETASAVCEWVSERRAFRITIEAASLNTSAPTRPPANSD